jgi:hypothetical protein
MSAKTVSDIIRETSELVSVKTAAFKEAAIAGGDGSDYPGAECDKPVPAAAGSADKEVKQDLPEGGTSSAGATDAEKIEAGHTVDSTQGSGESVEKKPMESADAEAKQASSATGEIANSLLNRIRAHQEKIAEAEKQASSCGDSGKKEKSAKEEPKKMKKEEKKAEEAEPQALELDLTTDVLAKIASVILSTEEGIQFTEEQMTKAAGAEAARETIEFLHKQAAYEQGSADAEAMIFALAQQQEAEKQAAAYAEAEKQAAAQQQLQYTEADLVKAGQALADEILAAQGDEEAGDLGTGEEGGDVVEDIAAAEEPDFSPEDLQAALAMMVQEGTIDEASAAMILEQLGLGAGAEPEADAAAAEAAAGMPAEEEGMEAMASAVKSAEELEASIVDAVKRVQAAKG